MRLRRRTRTGQETNGTSTDPRFADAATALAQARELAGAHAYDEAIDLLAAAFRRFDEDELAIALVDLRVEAARNHDAGEGRSPWPPEYADPFPASKGVLPEVGVNELTVDVLGGAVRHHGALIVRGVFDSDRVRVGVEAIQRAHTRRDVDDDDGWYRPVPFHGDKKSVVMNNALRQYVHKDGGVWLADSPRATAGFLDQLTERGVIGAISGHFGERPFISVQKSTLRHATTDKRNVSWHQDGAFIGEQVRTMNVWLALSRCGGDYPSPGLEVAPFRVPHVLPTGETLSLNAVSRKLVAEVTVETPVMVPAFEPGDALLFDELFLHRTYVTPQMTEDRYAIECWFFAPSHSAPEYLPLVV